MSFAFGGSPFGTAAGKATSNQAQSGPNLDEIQTEALGFNSLNGEAKVRLLPSPWPSDSLPPPTSSLLTVTSSKGLLAAAGPDSVVVARTESVRKAFEATSTDGDYRPFTPELTLPIGTRVSQVAFSADGSLLVLSAEQGGGLAIYETAGLLQGNTKSAFELPTNGSSIRALAPNPALPELFAVVTVKGELLIADMSNRQFTSGQNGQVLKEGVSSVSWSNKGKQLTAGMGTGTAVQLKPDGATVAEIPSPPSLQGDNHVSSISWLENDIFLMAYTPNGAGDGMPPASHYYVVTRHKDAPFTFSSLPEVCGPFGLNRSPAFQFMSRLRNFEPGLKDLIIVSSTASQDIGMFTRSENPLTPDVPADKIRDVFTTTSLSNDSRRAQMPMTEDMTSDTSPIGMALDLSSTTKVITPIPGDELESSPGPLPALLVLTNEGSLCGWWIVFSPSVRQGLTYSGMAATQGQAAPATTQANPSPFASSTTPSAAGQPVFGQNTFGSSSSTTPFGLANKPAAPTFGAPGAPAASSTFGSAGGLGQKQSPWGSATNSSPQTGSSAFGQPAFGSTSVLGTGAAANNSPQAGSSNFGKPAFGSASTLGLGAAPAFGSAGGSGAKTSPWGSASNAQATPSTSTTSVFGQASSFGAPKSSAFASPSSTTGSPFATAASNNASSSGGFASFANSGGFSSASPLSSAKPESGSIFSQSGQTNAFASALSNESSFGNLSKPSESTSSNPFGTSKEGFSITSSWKNPDAGKDSGTPHQALVGKSSDKTSSFFGDDFEKNLGDTSKATSASVSKETDMTSDNEESSKQSAPKPEQPGETTTPSDTPATSKPFGAPVSGGFFSTKTDSNTTPVRVEKSAPTPSIFEQSSTLAAEPSATTTPAIKEEPNDESEQSKEFLQAPLPPDTVSKTTYTPGTSSTSSMTASKASIDDTPLPSDFFPPSNKSKTRPGAEDAPLPPDFLPPTTQPASKAIPSPEDAPLPPDFLPSTKPKSPPTSEPSPSPPASTESKALPEDDENDALDDEGSGVDVANELTTTDKSAIVTPESSFGQKEPTSPLDGLFSKVSQPEAKQRQTKPLFGELGTSPAPFFPPPQPRIQQSPRSPSPVRRNVGDYLRPDPTRSVSAPGVPLRDSMRKVTVGRPMPSGASVSMYPPHSQSIPIERRTREDNERLQQQRAKIEAEEEQSLSDDEDERLREELDAPIEPNKILEPFLAHQDYAGGVRKGGIPGQIERVYRDINSMIDTLGMNSRALQSWIKGHEELIPDNGREKEDLEDPEDWAVDEIDSLINLQADIASELQTGKIENPGAMIASCRTMLKESERLCARQADIRRTIDAKLDAQVRESLMEAPLSAEQSAARMDLRRIYTNFKKELSEAEEKVMELKAALVAHAAAGKKGSSGKVPTIEAVEKTILKMTSMAEKRSGDIDMLEREVRRLGVSPGPTEDAERDIYSTPPPMSTQKKALIYGQGVKTPGSSVNGSGFYTPPSRGSVNRNRFSSSVGSNVSEWGGSSRWNSPRKSVRDLDREDEVAYARKAERKKAMHALLKEALVGGEVRIRTLDDL